MFCLGLCELTSGYISFFFKIPLICLAAAAAGRLLQKRDTRMDWWNESCFKGNGLIYIGGGYRVRNGIQYGFLCGPKGESKNLRQKLMDLRAVRLIHKLLSSDLWNKCVHVFWSCIAAQCVLDWAWLRGQLAVCDRLTGKQTRATRQGTNTEQTRAQKEKKKKAAHTARAVPSLKRRRSIRTCCCAVCLSDDSTARASWWPASSSMLFTSFLRSVLRWAPALSCLALNNCHVLPIARLLSQDQTTRGADEKHEFATILLIVTMTVTLYCCASPPRPVNWCWLNEIVFAASWFYI